MKKLLLPLVVIGICSMPYVLLQAQQVSPKESFRTVPSGEVHPVSGEPLKYCGTDEAMKALFDKNPGMKENFERLQAEAQINDEKNSSQPPQPYTIYTIPVVVHVLHNYGSENISDAQIKDAISILSRDYQKQNADTATVMAAFKPIIANIGFVFQLAQLDPNSVCTKGIDRIVTTLTNSASDAAKLNDWPSNKYLNIWTCASIGSGAAGYSYYPGIGASVDGVMILSSYIGSIGTGSPTTSRALTHEVGHWLNLQHPWGSTNQPGVACGDDGVTDTPVTKGWTSCSIASATAGVCTAGAPENIENYMDYAYCQKMFTIGQKNRMITAINSSLGGRNNVWQSSNLSATGVSGSAQLCVADFSFSKKIVCLGTPLSFTDLSWSATPTSWQWDFDNNGTVDATTQNPTYTYTASGVYTVKLTVSDGVNTKSVTKTNCITVIGNTASATFPYTEGFENSGYPYNDWYINLVSGTGPTWSQTTSAAYSGSASLTLNNYASTSPYVEEAISPSVDLSSTTNPQLTFRVAYAQRSSSDGDRLRALSSSDCGATWTQKFSKYASVLQTGGVVSTAFTPSGASQWRMETLNLASYAGSNNVRFKFEFTGNGGTGNNVYIDDINLNSSGYGVAEEFADGFNLNVFPNPFNDNTTISFNIIERYNISVGVYDIVGREIIPLSAKTELGAGTYSLPLNRNTLKPGIYFVKLNVDGYSVMKKVIVQ
jgi:PKD repeat protein